MSKGRCPDFKAVVRTEIEFGDVDVNVHVLEAYAVIFSNRNGSLCFISGKDARKR